MEITLKDAQKVLETVDAGLVKGLGKPVPGQMCIEAAVCFALGLPHGDEPLCVDPVLRAFKISLNDAQWSSTKARATGMRRLALAQLGSAGNFDSADFVRRLVMLIINKIIPKALRIVATAELSETCLKAIEDAALKCENVKDIENAARASAASAASAYAASRASAYAASAYAASAAEAVAANDAHANDDEAAACAANAVAAFAVAAGNAADKELSSIAEDVVQILINMNVPGVQWLYLAPYGQA